MHPFMIQQIAEDTRRERLAATSAPRLPRDRRRRPTAGVRSRVGSGAATASAFVIAATSRFGFRAQRPACCD